MKTDTITSYNLALMDVKSCSIPHRRDDGKYQWSNGQRSILNSLKEKWKEKYNPIDVQKEKRFDIECGIEIYRELSYSLLNDNGTQDIDEEMKRVEDSKTLMQKERKQLVEDMYNRGEVIEDELQTQWFENAEIIEEPTVEKSDGKIPEKKNFKSKLRHILQFIALWLTGEVFLTAIQWSVLRDEKSMEDIIVRSFAFGVCLGLFHFVSYKNKNHYRWEYVTFLGVSLSMIFLMLFGPLVINSLYPVVSNVDMAYSWDFSGGQESELAVYPIWVELFRRYDVVIPSAITFFAFLIMESFLKEKSIKEPTSIAIAPNFSQQITSEAENLEKEDFDNPIKSRFRFLRNSIKDADNKTKELKKTKEERLIENTANISFIADELSKLTASLTEKELEIRSLTNELYSLINELFSQLERYRTDYIDILRNDIKADLVEPTWPEEDDIFIYFKLNRHEKIQ